MTLTDDLREAAGGVDRRYKTERRRVLTRGPVSVKMLLDAAEWLERLGDEIRRLEAERNAYSNEITGALMPEIERLKQEVCSQRVALTAIAYGRGDPVTIAREALGNE